MANSEAKSVFTRIANFVGNSSIIYSNNKILYNNELYERRNDKWEKKVDVDDVHKELGFMPYREIVESLKKPSKSKYKN